MGASATCCVHRDAEEQAPEGGQEPVQVGGSPTSAHGGEECIQFFDCVEYDDAEEYVVNQRPKLRLLEIWLNRRKLGDTALIPGERPRNRLVEMWLNRRHRGATIPMDLRQSFQASLRNLPQDATVCLECTACMGRVDHLDSEVFSRANILNVTQAVQKAWEDRQKRGVDALLAEKLDRGFPELMEWTSEEVVRRMLRSAGGNEKEAVQTLNKAIECRVRDRELFRSMRCTVACDMRVIGRDLEQRPTLYTCARSQQQPLKEIRSQIFVAFEEAVRLAGSQEGQVVLIADMTGFSASLNVDPFVLRNLAESFGSVFADRLHSVLIVDFSLLAQTLWSTCRPLLSENTRKKINFVGERAARKIAQEKFDAESCERILSAFSVNRQKGSTEEERALQAQRTAMTEIPLGRPVADKAG